MGRAKLERLMHLGDAQNLHAHLPRSDSFYRIEELIDFSFFSEF